jgi:hypothetical protein
VVRGKFLVTAPASEENSLNSCAPDYGGRVLTFRPSQVLKNTLNQHLTPEAANGPATQTPGGSPQTTPAQG